MSLLNHSVAKKLLASAGLTLAVTSMALAAQAQGNTQKAGANVNKAKSSASASAYGKSSSSANAKVYKEFDVNGAHVVIKTGSDADGIAKANAGTHDRVFIRPGGVRVKAHGPDGEWAYEAHGELFHFNNQANGPYSWFPRRRQGINGKFIKVPSLRHSSNVSTMTVTHAHAYANVIVTGAANVNDKGGTAKASAKGDKIAVSAEQPRGRPIVAKQSKDGKSGAKADAGVQTLKPTTQPTTTVTTTPPPATTPTTTTTVPTPKTTTTTTTPSITTTTTTATTTPTPPVTPTTTKTSTPPKPASVKIFLGAQGIDGWTNMVTKAAEKHDADESASANLTVDVKDKWFATASKHFAVGSNGDDGWQYRITYNTGKGAQTSNPFDTGDQKNRIIFGHAIPMGFQTRNNNGLTNFMDDTRSLGRDIGNDALEGPDFDAAVGFGPGPNKTKSPFLNGVQLQRDGLFATQYIGTPGGEKGHTTFVAAAGTDEYKANGNPGALLKPDTFVGEVIHTVPLANKSGEFVATAMVATGGNVHSSQTQQLNYFSEQGKKVAPPLTIGFRNGETTSVYDWQPEQRAYRRLTEGYVSYNFIDTPTFNLGVGTKYSLNSINGADGETAWDGALGFTWRTPLSRTSIFSFSGGMIEQFSGDFTGVASKSPAFYARLQVGFSF